MSFSDWVGQSLTNYQTMTPRKATKESIGEFLTGLSARYKLWKAKRRGGWSTMQMAGASATVRVDGTTAMKRAEHLNGEQPVFEWLAEGINETTVCWDVGGYHGHYTVLFSDLGADVVVFEPCDENRNRISEHCRKNNSSVVLRDYALSDQNAMQRLTGPATSELQVTNKNTGWTVETKRGDDVAPKPDVVKVDVEGHEMAVLNGMAETLQDIDRIAIEVHDGISEHAISRRLNKCGLTVVKIPTDRSQTYIGGYQE